MDSKLTDTKPANDRSKEESSNATTATTTTKTTALMTANNIIKMKKKKNENDNINVNKGDLMTKNVNSSRNLLHREYKSEANLNVSTSSQTKATTIKRISSTIFKNYNANNIKNNKMSNEREINTSNSLSNNISNLSGDDFQKFNIYSIDETLLSLTKKKSLREYDEELKSLKEENFSLKLRIYMLEEDIAGYLIRLNEQQSQSDNASKKNENYGISGAVSSTRQNSSADNNNYNNNNSNTNDDDTTFLDEQDFISKLNETLLLRSDHEDGNEVNGVDEHGNKVDTMKKANQKRHKKTRSVKSLYTDDDDDDEKAREIENLNQLNLQLEKNIELLKSELSKKEKLIESNRNECENLNKKFEIFKVECYNSITEQMNEKFQKDLSEKLDDAHQFYFVREKELQKQISEMEQKIKELNLNLDKKITEIDNLKRDKVNSIKIFKNEAVSQIENLMEKLLEKDAEIKNLELKLKDLNLKEANNRCQRLEPKLTIKNNDEKSNSTSFDLLDLNLSDHQLIGISENKLQLVLAQPIQLSGEEIEQVDVEEELSNSDRSQFALTSQLIYTEQANTKQLNTHDLTESLRVHYQFIISDLENQLVLKETLLQKYILIAKDKDLQIHQLINVGILCNQDTTNEKKIEIFIRELRKSLEDKDTLFEKTIKEHFDLIKQKEETIINLKFSLKQYINDLNKANEILLQSENRIDRMQNELSCLENTKKGLHALLKQETEKFQEIMEDNRIEQSEKDGLVAKLQASLETLKNKLKKENENADLIQFYEDQLNSKEEINKEQRAKIEKLTSKLLNRTESSDEEINKLKSEYEQNTNRLIRENNQLRNELNKLNLEHEKLEMQFAQQVDEYEIEIESLKNKKQEKDNTIKNLISSAEEKDRLIVKLKSKYMSQVNNDDALNKTFQSDESENREELRKRKIEGLVKLIEEKNHQIESLKSELSEFKTVSQQQQNTNSSSMSDLNASFSNSITNSNTNSTKIKFGSSNTNFQNVMQSLEKEIEIYQKINNNKDLNLKQTLQEVVNLRNQLLRITILKENHDLIIKSRSSSNFPRLSFSNEDLIKAREASINDGYPSRNRLDKNNRQNSALLSFLSPRNNEWTKRSMIDDGFRRNEALNGGNEESMPSDSGLNSQKSNSTSESNVEPVKTRSQLKRTSSIPRPISSNHGDFQEKQPRSVSLSSNQIKPNINYALCSNQELINIIQNVSNENQMLKRQFDSAKAPKLTELHKETASLRNQLTAAKNLNDYLVRQFEIYQITHGNTDSLLEMAQNLNLTKEELEQYKQKIMRMKETSESSPNTGKRITELANTLSTNLNEKNAQNESSTSFDLPSRNIKITVATLEKELENWKLKYRRLQEMHDYSERICRYLAIKFNKYTPLLNGLGLFKPSSSLKRSLSAPTLNIKTVNGGLEFIGNNLNNNLDDAQFKKLLNKLVVENKSFEMSTASIDTTSSNILKQSFDLETFEVHKIQKVSPLRQKMPQDISSEKLSDVQQTNQILSDKNSTLREKIQQLEAKIDLINDQLREKEKLIEEQNSRLFYIYSGFKNLKANPKYLKQIFGEELAESFKDKLKSSRSDLMLNKNHEKVTSESNLSSDNLILNIFSGAVLKFDDISKKLEEKENLVKELEEKIESLNSQIKELRKSKAVEVNNEAVIVHAVTNEQDFKRLKETHQKSNLILSDLKEELKRINSNPALVRKLEKNQQEQGELLRTFWISTDLDEADKHSNRSSSNYSIQSTELKTKVKKYKEEIVRLKEKIKAQNDDIEEALEQLTNLNKEKENKKVILSAMNKKEDIRNIKITKLSLNDSREGNSLIDDYLADRLLKTHSKFKKARNNIQNKLEEQNN